MCCDTEGVRNRRARGPSPRRFGLAAALLIAVGMANCAYGSTAPSRQLDAGQKLTTGSLTWGVVHAGPRLEVGRRYGGQTGDLGIHGGLANLAALHAGASGRFYLGRWLTAGLHGEGGMMLPLGGGPPPGWLAVTTRWTTTTNDERPAYAGLQGNVTEYVRRRSGTPIFTAGIVGGFEVMSGGTVVQLELVLTPFVHQSFRRLPRDRQPRFAPRRPYAMSPGPFDFRGDAIQRNLLFSQLNVVVYNP